MGMEREGEHCMARECLEALIWHPLSEARNVFLC